jgi:hypothetical protein
MGRREGGRESEGEGGRGRGERLEGRVLGGLQKRPIAGGCKGKAARAMKINFLWLLQVRVSEPLIRPSCR